MVVLNSSRTELQDDPQSARCIFSRFSLRSDSHISNSVPIDRIEVSLRQFDWKSRMASAGVIVFLIRLSSGRSTQPQSWWSEDDFNARLKILSAWILQRCVGCELAASSFRSLFRDCGSPGASFVVSITELFSPSCRMVVWKFCVPVSSCSDLRSVN